MSESRGMQILRSNDTSLLVRMRLLDGAGAKVTTGTTTLRIFHLVPTDGTLEAFDFDDDTFKSGAGALTTPTTAMTHQATANDSGTHDTGIWTVRLTTLADFELGHKYTFEVENSGASPTTSIVEYQYGGTEGDQDSGVKPVASFNVQGTSLRVEVGLEKDGAVVTTPTAAQVQIFDEANSLVANIGAVEFQAIGARGFFAHTLASHTLTAGKTYQAKITITDGGNNYINTKAFKILSAA